MSKKWLALFMLSVFVFSGYAGSAAYGEGNTGDYMIDIGTKFGRGLKNVVTSPAEIPCTMADDMGESKVGGFFTGFGKGTVFMLRRILVGASEIASFVIPMEATIPNVCQVD